MEEQKTDELLWGWLAIDVLWTAFLFGGAAYVVFKLGRSPWWFLLAYLLGGAMGGGGLYKALNKRFGLTEEGEPASKTEAEGS